MIPEFFTSSIWLEAAWSVIVFLIFILAGWLIMLLLRYLQKRLEKKRKRNITSQVLNSITRTVFIFLVLEGVIQALYAFRELESWQPLLFKASISVLIIFITYGIGRAGTVLISWYMGSRAVRRKATVDQGLVRFLRRILVILIYIIGILILLDYLGIVISPLIAGLGIGGLAVALALQPTLANFFAGTQIVADRVVRMGDYIELDDGTRGYVTDVGWRSTRIRTPFNNIVIIPNSRLAESIITNFYGPSMELAVIVSAGVSYASDLWHVEEVALSVTKEVIEELDGAVKTFEPWFGYETFGESNIDFWVWLQARDRIASFIVKSELMKRLHSRFREEGIEINYPVRKVTFENGTRPEPEEPPQ